MAEDAPETSHSLLAVVRLMDSVARRIGKCKQTTVLPEAL